jgi:hypothetical protein
MEIVEGPPKESIEIAVEEVQLRADAERKFIDKLMGDLEHDLKSPERAELEAEWETSVKQWNTQLYREDVSDDDYTASKLDFPTTRKHGNLAVARHVVPLFQNDQLMVGRARFANKKAFAIELEKAFDFLIDGFDMRDFAAKAMKHAEIYGFACAQIPFVRKIKKVRQTMVGEGGRPEKIEIDVPVEQRAVPRLILPPDLIWPINYGEDVDALPYIARKVWRTRDEIKAAIDRGEYRSKSREGKKTILQVIGDPTSKGREEKYDYSRSDEEEGRRGGEESEYKLFECLEVYTTYQGIEVIVLVEKESRAVFRFVYNFYDEDQRGMKFLQWDQLDGTLRGESLCRILLSSHRAISAIRNQELDAASKANAGDRIIAATNNEIKKVIDSEGFWPELVEVNPTVSLQESIVQLRRSQPYSRMANLHELMENDAQMMAGQNPQNFGIQTTERPTATGTVRLIEEGDLPRQLRLERFRDFLSSVAMCMMARQRQYWPDGFQYYVQENPDAQLTHHMFQWPEGYWREGVVLECKVSSQTINKQLRRQELMAVMEAIPEIADKVMMLAQASTSPSGIALIGEKYLRFYVNQVKEWAREMGLEGPEELDVGEEINAERTYMEKIGKLEEMVKTLIQQINSLTQTTVAAGESARGMGQGQAGQIPQAGNL